MKPTNYLRQVVRKCSEAPDYEMQNRLVLQQWWVGGPERDWNEECGTTGDWIDVPITNE